MIKNSSSPFQVSDRLALFPDSTRIQNDSLFIAGHDLASLADRYLTPLYVYDRATMDASVVAYKGALKEYYPAPSEITYAGKAFLCKAIAEWTQEHKLWVDCTGEGEIAIAVAGNVPREHILVHGVNKSTADLNSAIQRAGTIVVDNLTELKRIHVTLSDSEGSLPKTSKTLTCTGRRRKCRSQQTLPQSDINIWLRLLPGVSVDTHHAHTQTGQHESKFGMTREEILEAANFCKEHNLPLKGIHFHQGSNFRDATPLVRAIEIGLDLAKEIGLDGEWHFSPGGGWGVAYHEDELPQPDIDEYVRIIAKTIKEGCKTRGLTLPHLHLEPGRSLVARAGVAIYKVGAIKRRGDKVWILTDGGMTDNPRYAMYGARYSCLTLTGVERERNEKVSIAGPYCESGDVVIEDLFMPKVEVGEFIAIPAAGAYHLSMSSNYNGARRPAVLWLEEGQVKEIIRRETTDDLLKRDIGLM
ncbi:MAG: diaminopimelate decarboxylase [Anaerolineae bacterium]|nr:diaminopimelate decarboxylase [Anaerolineae bacterium]